jgi:hypothetical protein
VPYAEIELSLNPLGQSLYQVELRITDPTTDALRPPAQGRATLNPVTFADLESTPLEYGKLLATQVFSTPEVQRDWAEALAAFRAKDLEIRLRLRLASGDITLQSFRWELLTDLNGDLPLSTSKEIHFSRFLSSRDWRNVKLCPRQSLKATIAIAAPTNLKESLNLASIDIAKESEPILAALKDIETTLLPHPLTLKSLTEALQTSPDILYLVCHGMVIDDKPILCLADDQGLVTITAAKDLAAEIARLDPPPRLVVLASCQSAAPSETTLATLLAAAGIPAVVAMQGNISMASIQAAMPLFFKELLKDGQIDRALSTARFEVRDNHDAWMPVLLLRLKSGRIWYDPGFSAPNSTNDFWGDLCLQIHAGNALPIIGPDLVVGASSEIALKLATEEGFPLSPADRNDLAKVAQYLAITKGIDYTRNAIQQAILNQKTANFDPIAKLPLSAFINATAHGKILASLKAQNKKPLAILSKWRRTPTNPSPVAPQIEASEFSVDRPLVYSIFGDCQVPDHWVLTEDDFFDFTVSASQYKLIPPHVSSLFCTRSLLFLGFSLDSWIFRALFRMIMMQEGISLQQGKTHIGVQLDPEDARFTDPERARKYLINYFASTRRGSRGEPQIDVYWGSSVDFLNQLTDELAKRPNISNTQTESEYADR